MKKNLEYVADVYCKILEILYAILLKPIFSLIAFIFWRNKYSKQYWEWRKSWRKTMHRLRSRAQKDIILTTIVPALEKQGFERSPYGYSYWGWRPSTQGYEYTMFRLKDGELQSVRITTSYRYSFFHAIVYVYKLIPDITKIAELEKYDSLILFPENNHFRLFIDKIYRKFRLKAFGSEKELEKKVSRLKLKFETWASNIDNEFDNYRKKYSPPIIDINKKLKEIELERQEEIAKQNESAAKRKRRAKTN